MEKLVDDRRALMAAIIANPDEDTPRLALADWLDEYGDTHDRARAEFIRLQIAESTTKSASAAKKLAKRAATIHKRHARHWLGPLWELCSNDRDRQFRRGILAEWRTTAGNFLKPDQHTATREWFPLVGVDELILDETTKRVGFLAVYPALAWVTNLTWYGAKLEDDGFAALASSVHFERLSRLTIDKPRCTDAGLKALARSKGFPNLRALELSDGLWRGDFSAGGVRQILDSANFPRLDELGLIGAHTHAVTHRTLWTYKNLARLRALRVGFDNDMKALAKCPHLTNLEELYVEDSTMTDADARTLADNPAFARLKVLALTDMNTYHPPLSAEGERALRARFGKRLTLEYSVLCRED